MTKQTCEFIPSSEVFADAPQAFDLLSYTNRFTWGDNNRSLVTAARILEALDLAAADGEEQKQVDIVIKRLESLGETYVDLEN